MTIDDAALPRFPPELAAPSEPAPLFARLRREQPVATVRLPTGAHAWLVTRHDDNRRVLGDPRFSRAAAASAGAPRARPIPLEQRSITALDPPRHTAIRRAVLPWFTRAAADRMRPGIERTAAALLDRLVAAGEPADLVALYTRPFALTVLGDLLGVAAADRDRFGAATDAYLATGSADAAEGARAALTGSVTELVGRRCSDLVAGLADSGLTHDEVVALVVTLAVAGYQTVANALAGSVLALLRHPDQHRRLVEGRVPLPTAVEELLRYTPISVSGGTIRVATCDAELGGVPIRTGQAVLPSTTSANRDGTVFADADRLDLARHPNPHLAFGHGAHRCLGAHLARVQLQVALDALVTRLPGLRLAVPLEALDWRLDTMIRGPRELPVHWLDAECGGRVRPGGQASRR